MYINAENVTYFYSFGVEHIAKEINRIQANDLIMCEYYCIGFIDLLLKGHILLDYTNLYEIYTNMKK